MLTVSHERSTRSTLRTESRTRARLTVTVVVPALNAEKELPYCLDALLGSTRPPDEIIVVDDGSRDGTADVARAHNVQLMQLDQPHGPASARNHGARLAKGDIVLFVDADVVLHPDSVERVIDHFDREPAIGALFGTYDSEPAHKDFVSQYRNLLHYYTHMHGEQRAETFWSGCGAVRRSVFEEVGGFDEAMRAMEDVELGYRLRAAGQEIRLYSDVLSRHLKRWTFRSMIVTDIFHRALPWSRLILETGVLPARLNLSPSQRVSAMCAALAAALTPVAFFYRWTVVPIVGCVGLVVYLNRGMYRFFARHRSRLFAIRVLPLHLLYYLYSVGSFAWLWLARFFWQARHVGDRVMPRAVRERDLG
jgi:GT2 family glycosyltransferase